MSNALIFGFPCPICGEGHLLSSLGVRPIVEDVDEPLEPTLDMIEDSEDGELHAICGFCEGEFTVHLKLKPVEPPAPGPHLKLV